MTKLDPEVYKLGSGLHVVTDDVESVRKAARAARRGRNRLKAQRAAQRRTGGSKGKASWKDRAKTLGKLERAKDAPDGLRRQIAYKVMNTTREKRIAQAALDVHGRR